MVTLNTANELGHILKTDNEFKIQSGYIKPLPLDFGALPAPFQKSNKEIYYFNHFLDTIFNVSKGYPLPSIVIDYGKYKIGNERLSIDQQNNKILNSPHLQTFNAGKNCFFLNINYPSQWKIHSVLYRISDGKHFLWSELINDIDNGTLDRWPGFLAGNEIVFWLMPTTILEHLEKMAKTEKQDPKNSGFVDMASKITLESNPVIMVCKLKN